MRLSVFQDIFTLLQKSKNYLWEDIAIIKIRDIQHWLVPFALINLGKPKHHEVFFRINELVILPMK